MRDLSKICAPKSVQTAKSRKGEGYITIVNSKKKWEKNRIVK